MRDADLIAEILSNLMSLDRDGVTRFQEFAGSSITVNNFYSTVDVNEQRIDVANGDISNSNMEFETEERVVGSRRALDEDAAEGDDRESGADGNSSEEYRKAAREDAVVDLIIRLIESENEKTKLERRCGSLGKEVRNLRDWLASSQAKASGYRDELVVANGRIDQLEDENSGLCDEAREKGEAAARLMQRIAGAQTVHIIAGCSLICILVIIWAWYRASMSNDPNSAISALIIGVLAVIISLISTVSYSKIKAKRVEAISRKTGLGSHDNGKEGGNRG